MPEFAYTARSAIGQDVAGSIVAGSRREVLAALAERSLFPMHVEAAKEGMRRWKLERRINAELISATLTQLADLLQNGVPLLGALEVVCEQATHSGLAEVLIDIRDEVADGMSLNDAFARHGHVFSELTISMIRAGTEGAFLEDALRRTADFLELQQELKARVAGAMAYPAFLAVVGSIVTLVLIVFFVPKFAELFEQLEQQDALPWATVALLSLSDTLGRYGLFFVLAFGGAIYAVRRWMASEKGRIVVDRWKLKLPLFGKIFLNTAVSRFSRVLGTLLRNGVPLLKALDISSESAGNRLLARAITDSAQNISSGDTLSQPLADCGLIPRPVMAMISVAEESNNLENVLINVANGIDRKVSRQLDMMVRLIEPLLLLVMGGVILFVIVALLLPVFEMSATLT